MAFMSRIILGLLLLLQSFPGLTAGNCAIVTPGLSEAFAIASADDNSPSTCCGGLMMAACPAGGPAIACECDMRQDETPRIPFLPPTTESAHQFVAPLPTRLTSVEVEPPSTIQRPTHAAGRPKRSANSIQSLLCVWVV